MRVVPDGFRAPLRVADRLSVKVRQTQAGPEGCIVSVGDGLAGQGWLGSKERFEDYKARESGATRGNSFVLISCCPGR